MSRSRRPDREAERHRGRIRSIAFWVSTVVVLAELVAGSVWNLATIDWVEMQMSHLGYPHFFAYVLGACHVAAAAAIIAPGFGRLKDWAYAGTVLMWLGAVVSHLTTGDSVVSWGPPLMFAVLALTSWALRPADRRRDGRPATHLRAWAVPIGLLAALYAVSILTLPAAEDVTREWPAKRGWISE
ncbi:hypothetical protein GCM10029976_009150 [Kribbella albertanoniae]|uniref:DoxX family protein n=1 Tax=Kribbella albertanoniae TaxID=1266829 RepID=A0A4R4Q5D7_9ACTN|nr:DoxX family protein [Kribbella albertanoniae]TDC30179.1 DoxX family protein [Kribbella albertanoniae]